LAAAIRQFNIEVSMNDAVQVAERYTPNLSRIERLHPRYFRGG